MNTNFITSNDIKIAYLETDAPAEKLIFFIHGNSSAAGAMHRQLCDEIFKGYKLLAPDLPAHGNSDAAANPEEAYSIPALAKTMAKTITGIAQDKPYVLVGLSLGSNIMAEMLPYCKPVGLVAISTSIIGADHPMEKAFREGLDATVFFTDAATEENINNFARDSCFFPGKNAKDMIISDYKKVKPNFRPMLMKTALEGKMNDQIQLLRESHIPVLVIFGKEDKFSNPDYMDDKPFEMWNDRVYKIPEAGHFAQMDQPKIVNELLLEYCENRFCKPKAH